MDINEMIKIPDENPNLPPKLKEARDMFRYASIFFLIAALLYGLWGLWSIMRGLMWTAWGWGTWRIMWGIVYLIFAGIALVVKGKFEEASIRPIDQGMAGTVKDNLIIYIILGFIFGWILSGLLILLGYMKLDEVDTQANMCPNCRSSMRYIQDYQRWYCDNCQDYKVPIHPASATQAPQQQQEWGQTPPPPEQQQEQGWQQSQQQPPQQQSQQQQSQQQQSQQQQPPQQQQGWQQDQNVCPNCNQQTRYIPEYNKNYCDNCQKYV